MSSSKSNKKIGKSLFQGIATITTSFESDLMEYEEPCEQLPCLTTMFMDFEMAKDVKEMDITIKNAHQISSLKMLTIKCVVMDVSVYDTVRKVLKNNPDIEELHFSHVSTWLPETMEGIPILISQMKKLSVLGFLFCNMNKTMSHFSVRMKNSQVLETLNKFCLHFCSFQNTEVIGLSNAIKKLKELETLEMDCDMGSNFNRTLLYKAIGSLKKLKVLILGDLHIYPFACPKQDKSVICNCFVNMLVNTVSLEKLDIDVLDMDEECLVELAGSFDRLVALKEFQMKAKSTDTSEEEKCFKNAMESHANYNPNNFGVIFRFKKY